MAPRTVTATPVPRTMRAITHSIFEEKDGVGGRWRRKQMEEDEEYEGGLRRKNIVEYEEEGGLRRRIDVEE